MYKDITAVSSFIPFVFTGSSCRKNLLNDSSLLNLFRKYNIDCGFTCRKDFSKIYPIQVDITDLPKNCKFSSFELTLSLQDLDFSILLRIFFLAAAARGIFIVSFMLRLVNGGNRGLVILSIVSFAWSSLVNLFSLL